MQLTRVASLGLGILTAVGGFVDMGGVITSSQAGALFRYSLLWTLIPGVIGLIVYADMAGRVAIASGQALFDVIRDRLGFKLALIPLAATAIVNTLTLVVELAGMSLALQLASGISYLLWFPLTGLLLGIILWRASFGVLEDGAAALGLTMLVAVAALVVLAPPWPGVGVSVVSPDLRLVASPLGYLFMVVALLGAYMTPYQFYFYSSGAIEEGWSGPDFLTNRVTVIVGSIFGAIIVFALMVSAGQVLYPRQLPVNSLAEAGLPIVAGLGTVGWALFIAGVFAVSMGAGLESALSGAYSVCQYFGWEWGKRVEPREAPLFHLIYMVMLILAIAIGATGIDPILLTTVTMAVAGATLPFTFLPLLIVANDEDYMGDQRNTPAINLVAFIILGLLLMVTVAAIPLLALTRGGP